MAMSINTNQLLTFGALDQKVIDFLRLAIESRNHILISGNIGSGRVSFMQALESFLLPNMKKIKISHFKTIQVKKGQKVRKINVEKQTTDLTRTKKFLNAVYKNPEVIMLDNILGTESFEIMRQTSQNSFQLMASIQADSSVDALERLEAFALLESSQFTSAPIRKLISNSFDFIIQFSRLDDGKRRVMEISQVFGYRNQNIELKNIIEFRVVSADPFRGIEGRWEWIERPIEWFKELEGRGIKIPDTLSI
jgi:pilus assembly protein CpaF